MTFADDGWRAEGQGGPAAPPADTGYTHDPYMRQGPPPQTEGHAPQAQGHVQPQAEARTNVFAVVSLISSILGLLGVLAFLGSLIGIVFAILARKEIAADPAQGGKGFADWGMILGIVGLVFWLFMGVLMMMMAAMFGGFFWWGDPWWY